MYDEYLLFSLHYAHMTHSCGVIKSWEYNCSDGGVLYRAVMLYGYEVIVSASGPQEIVDGEYSQTVYIFDKEFKYATNEAFMLHLVLLNETVDSMTFAVRFKLGNEVEDVGTLRLCENGEVWFNNEVVSTRNAKRKFAKYAFLSGGSSGDDDV